MRLVPAGIVVLFTTALAYLILYAAFASVFHSPRTYEGLPEENDAILAYLAGGAMPAFLNEAEQDHMRDVRVRLFAAFIIYLLCLGAVIGILGTFLWKRNWLALEDLLGRSLFWSGSVLLGLCFIAGLAFLLSFQKTFVLFHAVLFPQGGWLFPPDSTLIQLYPERFFQSFGLRFGLRLLFATILTVVVGLAVRVTGHAGKKF